MESTFIFHVYDKVLIAFVTLKLSRFRNSFVDGRYDATYNGKRYLGTPTHSYMNLKQKITGVFTRSFCQSNLLDTILQ